MNVHEALIKMQTELKAPKNMYNSFGKYKYRNFEGICEAVKPMLKQTGTTLTVSDEITQVGDRYYVTATAVLRSVEDGSEVSASASAREPIEKKGMDEAQITGATSSYARKYCLNGLFLIDDTKDPDTDEYHKQTTEQKSDRDPVVTPTDEDKKKPATFDQIVQIERICKKERVPAQFIASSWKVEGLDKLTMAQAYATVTQFDKFKSEYEKTLPFK